MPAKDTTGHRFRLAMKVARRAAPKTSAEADHVLHVAFIVIGKMTDEEVFRALSAIIEEETEDIPRLH